MLPVRADGLRHDSESAVLAKRAKLQEEEAEDDGGLCCCEYVNARGERSHLAASCCDCEDLDEACDRWLKRQPQKPGAAARLLAEVSDRARLPCPSGARKLSLLSSDPSSAAPVVTPLVLLPALLHVAALHPLLLGAVLLAALPAALAWCYRLTKGRTRFFFGWTLASVGYMSYMFAAEVWVEVGWVRSAPFAAGMVLGLLALARTRKDPGFVVVRLGGASRLAPPMATDSVAFGGARREAPTTAAAVTKWADLRDSDQQITAWAEWLDEGAGGGKDPLWCEACKARRPPRAGHCRVCGVCVRRLDHHCMWIDCCVGQANHASFLLTLLLFLSAALYGVGLALRTLCPRTGGLVVFAALFRCPGAFERRDTALAFACAWYGSLVAAALLHLLATQLINVGRNVTGREARRGAREGAGKTRCYWGLVVGEAGGVHDRGFRRNWVEFMRMESDLYAPSPSPTDVSLFV